MRLSIAFVALTVVLVSLPVAAASAQGGGESQGQPRQHSPEDPPGTRGSKQDRDTMQDRDMAPGQQQRARQHSPLRDSDIYGRELMTQRERAEYRASIMNAETAEERERLRSEHQAEIKERAMARGVQVAPASEGPIYGGRLMTAEERNEHREALRRLGEERERFIAEHREKMRARAEERGVELEEDE